MIKALALVALAQLVVTPARAVDVVSGWSLYNSVVPGRLRLPYGDDPSRSYNVSVTNLNALLRSHEIDGASRPSSELRVLVLGDSSVWGFRLGPEATVAAQLNQLGLHAQGRRLRFFNLGYPTMSLLKDLLLLDRGLAYRPDLIVWLVTLESFPLGRQADSPLVAFNRLESESLLAARGIDPGRYFAPALPKSVWEGGLFGRRQEFAELFRLQAYGLMWAASGIDHDISAAFGARAEDLEPDATFQGFGPSGLTSEDLAWEILKAGVEAAGTVPVWIVNEPMFISQGANSDIRYNFFYPRWAYDLYRPWLSDHCREQGWSCLDLWDSLPAAAFTDSAVHYNAGGAETLSRRLAEPLLSLAEDVETTP